MKRIHIVNPYRTPAMMRMVMPLLLELPALYVVSEGQTPDESADLNYHIPYHSMTGYERTGTSKHVILYTHCNPPDKGNLLDACERADAIICMAFKGRRELINMGVDPEKLHVIYAAADMCNFRRRNIGIVSAVQPNGRKREGLLIDLAWQYDLSPFQFLIVGYGWESTVNALRGAGVSVQYIGEIPGEQMPKFYQSIDALLVTGYVEGGPLPILEALASGVRVISPPVGYAADLLEECDLYETLEELMDRLDGLVSEKITNYHVVRSWGWLDYAAEHALVFGRLLSDCVDLYPRRGAARYAQLLDAIDDCKPKSIVEIGTWNGNRAIQMVQQAAKYHPIQEIYYQGFDLFETQTGEHFRREYSKESYPLEVVRRRVEATGADVQLVKGDTTKFKGQTMPADLFFIDGGHSEETLWRDWLLVRRSMLSNSVIVFDDYYHANKPRGVGCNTIVDDLDRDYWNVEHLPVSTSNKYGQIIGMVKVSLKNANVHTQRQEQSYFGETYSISGTDVARKLSDVWIGNVARPTNPVGQLERTPPAPGAATEPGGAGND